LGAALANAYFAPFPIDAAFPGAKGAAGLMFRKLGESAFDADDFAFHGRFSILADFDQNNRTSSPRP